MTVLPATAPPRPSLALASCLALLACCPVLVNLIACFREGESFVITSGTSVAVVVVMGAVVLWRGAACRWGGPLALCALVAAVFWAHYLMLALLFPSQAGPEERKVMGMLPAYAVLWIILPLALSLFGRHLIDVRQVVGVVLVLMIAYVVLCLVRFGLGQGNYMSGRWNPGDSLESIRAGRYAGAGLFLALALAVIPGASPAWRQAGLLLIGPTLFLIMAANARGPWLSLFAGLVLCGPALAMMLWKRMVADVRVAVGVVVMVVVIVAGIGLALGSVESNFDRLFDSSQDGGSASGRKQLLLDYVTLFEQQPAGLITGFGYGHRLFYPHNLFLEIASVGGLPLVVLFLVYAGVVVAQGLRWTWRGDGLMAVVLGMFAIGLMGAQFSGSLGNEMMPWLTGFLVLVRAEECQAERDADPERAAA